MRDTWRVICIVCLVLGVALVAFGNASPAAEAAAALVPAQDEVVSVVVDYRTSFGGNRILGSVIARRPLLAPYYSDWSFEGTFNGRWINASGTVLEDWLGQQLVEFTCTSLNVSPGFNWVLLFVTKARVEQKSPELVQLMYNKPFDTDYGGGVRSGLTQSFLIRINGVIHEPGRGDGQLQYYVSQYGDGSPVEPRGAAKLPGGREVRPSVAERIPVLRDLLPFFER